MTSKRKLPDILRSYGSVCIGYSGGVDSVFLAVSAVDILGPANVLAVTGRSASYPDVQWDTARAIAAQFDIPHLEIDTDEMADANYVSNPVNRCYFCKTELWTKLVPVAAARGLATVADGSNADDAADYRPGARAAREHGVRSPLLDAGLTKAEIRELSKARGLPTWDHPSAPCLSSRLPYGLAVTPERLRQVEAAEHIVRTLGVREFRVRHHGDVARIEVAPAEMSIVLQSAPVLVAELMTLGFGRVLLDVEGYRRGALNESRDLVQLSRPTPENADVMKEGHAGDIAVVGGQTPSLEEVRGRAPGLRKQGFRYVAVDLERVS